MSTQSKLKTHLGYLLGGLSIIALSACATSPLSKTSPVEKSQTLPAPTAITAQSLRLDATLNAFVDKGYLAGVSVLVHKDGAETYYGQAGYRDLEAKAAISRTDVGRYYSMTKPIVGVALMQLYEQGKFKLDDPISKHLPEFANLQVFKSQNKDGSLELVAPNRPVTVRDLMRHTAGLTYGRFSDTPVDMEYRKAELMHPNENVEAFSKKLGTLPLLLQPGTKWIYSVGVDVQGRLIEALSGQSLGEYLQDNIFDPLDMSHTGFSVKPSDKDKFGPAYVVDVSSGKPVLIRLTDTNAAHITKNVINQIDANYLSKPTFESGGGGLVSTIDDYAHFAEMLLRGGKTNGKRILNSKTIALMSQDHLGKIDNGFLDESFGFGLDFAVKLSQIDDPKSNPMPVGSYYWGGLAGTTFWIDPSNNSFTVAHMQLINPYDPTIRNSITKAVYGK